MLEHRLTNAIWEQNTLQVAILLTQVPEDKDLLGRLLIQACAKGFTDIDLFLDRGADINFNPINATPLIYACEKGHVDIAKTLLERDADPDIADGNGWAALHLACDRGHSDIVKLLVKNGATIDMQYDGGLTPLQLACMQGYTDVVEFLLSTGADASIQTEDGETAWMLARSEGHMRIVTMLEQHVDQATIKLK